ncbi:hypothetical protein ACP4OV_011249 [Aristida adscensionis]
MPSRWAAPPFYGGLGDRAVDSRDLVVKVKYNDTLKRFNACVNGPHFDHDLAALRSKIACAFKFDPDAEFILTYTDEDEDVVMLDDDNDLRDAAISQKLNPLRINVQLKSNKTGTPRTKQPASNSRSLRSTALEDQLAQVKSAIDEALKFVPEQVPAVLAKLSHDLRSRAASSAPSLAELLDRFAKMLTPSSKVQPSNGTADISSCSSSDWTQTFGNSKIKHVSSPLTGSASETTSDMQSSETPKELGLKSVLSEESLVFTSSVGMKSDCKGSADTETKRKSDACSKGKSVISSTVMPPIPNTSHSARNPWSVPAPSMGEVSPSYVPNSTYGSNGKTNGGIAPTFPNPWSVPAPSMGEVLPCYVPNSTYGLHGKTNSGLAPPTFPLKSSMFHPPPPPPPAAVMPPPPAMPTPVMPWQSALLPTPNIYSPLKLNSPLVSSYLPSPEGVYSSGSSRRYDMPSSLSNYLSTMEGLNTLTNSHRDLSVNYGNIPQPALHRWIQCDGCGVTPIYGPRYKSNVKQDYDLCGVCFSHMGNAAEYTKLDRPASVRDRRLLGQLPPVKLKPDCCFVKDVTVPDGTLMAPSTLFTKIWRMRNSGPTIWPFGTQLTWVGGDQFAHQCSAKLAISMNGLPVNQEIDVAVDFVAPGKPGRYISYWKMALPSGQTFGQRAWVHIQVEQPMHTSGNKQAAAINLNLPPDANSTKQPFVVDVNSNPTAPNDLCPIRRSKEPTFGCTSTEILAHFHENIKAKESEPVPSDTSSASTAEPVLIPITDADASSFEEDALDLMPAGVPAPVASILLNPASTSAAVGAPMPAPAVNVPVLANAVSVPVAAPISVPNASLPDDETINHMEEKQLRELEHMGFMQVDLNKEILRQNKYNLQQSILDLCGFNEWDPILGELSELGFDDAEMNKDEEAESDEEGYVKLLVTDLRARRAKKLPTSE